MTARFSLHLSAAPGAGLLSRRGSSILWIPDPDDRATVLLKGFDAAAPGQEWVHIAETVLDRDFDMCAFACVIIGEQIELRVFGSLALTTDLRSVPMLSGASSSTWVEHRVSASVETARITAASDEEVDDRTDLVIGTVHAGAFSLTIRRGAERPPMPPERFDLGSTRVETTERTPEPDSAASPADPEATADSDAPIVSEAAADPEATLDPGSALVPARRCKAGHANPPSRATCVICETFLPAGPDAIVSVQRPPLGVLIFDDGRSIDLTSDLVLGRAPELDGATAIIVDGDRVSRTHLTVRCEGWEVVVEDCGSRNGTVVVPGNGGQPVSLVGGEPHPIAPGTSVYFGACSFVYEPPTG